MKRIYTYALLFITFLSASKLKAQVNVSDSLALVDLYNSTDGPHWTHNKNWLTPQPVAKWYGISVTPNKVDRIELNNNKLSGSIPSSLGSLTNLRFLELAGNNLNGSIPSSLGNLTNLLYLELDGNHLSGSIPSSLGNLTYLWDLGLYC